MDHDFWHQRWQAGQLGFHQPEGNDLFTAHFHRLGVPTGGRVFLPLCGKTGDIAWLLDKGMCVAGAELSEIAIRDLFADLRAEPEVTPLGDLTRWSAPGLDIFVGDVFALDAGTLGPVDALYDRAALVALPAQMRPAYATHMRGLAGRAPMLTVTFDYDQSLMDGPPFAVSQAAVQQLYGDTHAIAVLQARDARFKDAVPVTESALLLRAL